ncbi:hypothetical protein C1645_842691, partial [Glomus cerebriforme]
EQVINPSTPQSPESPPTPPNPEQNKPTNPIVENNQKSEENIKDISQTASLEEAKQKARQEINDLLDRYGQKAITEIKELLKKHPFIKSKDLSIKGQKWEEKLNSLTSQQQILNLARQLRENIIQLDNQQKQKQKQNSTNVPLKIAIPVGLGVLGTLAIVGLFIIRHRKIAHSKIKNKSK